MWKASCFLLLARTALAQQYFPPEVLGKTPAEHEATALWSSKHLKALHEPSLMIGMLALKLGRFKVRRAAVY
jgi:hypothetical protein